MSDKSKKAKKIFARIGFSDVIVPIENRGNPLDIDTILNGKYLIGYEDENEDECDEEGNYL